MAAMCWQRWKLTKRSWLCWHGAAALLCLRAPLPKAPSSVCTAYAFCEFVALPSSFSPAFPFHPLPPSSYLKSQQGVATILRLFLPGSMKLQKS
eukprot:539849-Pelagomonas_calceolata.AAC.2